MNNIKIQKMKQEDIKYVLLAEKSHNIHILNENILKQDIQDKKYYYLVAKDEYNNIAGYIGISCVLDTADLISLVVHKDYTNQGIATLLLQAIYEFLKENNMHKIILEVRSSNIPAQKLYNKHGFKQISIRKKYYDNFEDAFIYEKLL